MTNSPLYEKGLAIRKELRGEAGFEANRKDYAADPMTQDFIDVVTETMFGALWALRRFRCRDGTLSRAGYPPAVRAPAGLD